MIVTLSQFGRKKAVWKFDPTTAKTPRKFWRDDIIRDPGENPPLIVDPKEPRILEIWNDTLKEHDWITQKTTVSMRPTNVPSIPVLYEDHGAVLLRPNGSVGVFKTKELGGAPSAWSNHGPVAAHASNYSDRFAFVVGTDLHITHFTSVSPVTKTNQIGRASCRERVCLAV